MKSTNLLSNVLKGLMMAATVVVAAPHLSMAQDLAKSVTTLTGTELVNVPDVINACFYIGGAAFTGSGLLKLKAYSENPGQTPLGQGVGRVSVGAGLLALPYISTAVISSLGIGDTSATYQQFNAIK